MTPKHIAELERVLRTHREWIAEEYEKSKNRHTTAYLKLAGYLRILLVDNDMPVLLRFAEERGKTLHAYVSEVDLRSLEGKPMWGWFGFVVSWTPERESVRVTAEEFLDRAIGLYSDCAGLACTYTPRQLIKYTANKEGVAHLDLTKPRALLEMKLMTIADQDGSSDSQEIKHAIRAIAAWTYNAIGFVLDETS
ncbi:MAG: hypothetical protein H7A45_03885 [Verrucomicrobiales bacterium]|nr:hypothetical protein [Verrucomicrobiales bacterium]